MRKDRSIRKRGFRRKKHVIDLDITSLLDILVIMLVFLLKSYNTSGVLINIPDDVSLPISETKKANSEALIVQVSKNTIWIDDKKILSNEKGLDQAKDIHFENGLITPLKIELEKRRQLVKSTKETIKEANPEASEGFQFTGIVNLVVDKEVGYNFLKKVMHTCAESGFQTYKFVVLGEDQ